jgi:hypothetical protein
MRRLAPSDTLKCLLAAAGLVAAVLVVPPVATEALWQDAEHGAGTVNAATIPPPVMVPPCDLSPGALGATPVITVKWQLPAGTSYTVADINYYVARGGLTENLTSVLLGTNLTTTGPVSGVYTTQFKSALLGGLLGGSYEVYVETEDPTGWTSKRAAARASMGALGANPSCTVL